MGKSALAAAVWAASAMPAICAGYNNLNVGIDYLNQGRNVDAITWLDKALAAGDLVPDQIAVARMDRGIAYTNSGEPEKAIADFTAALAIRPGDFMLLSDRSFAYVSANQPEKALADIATLQADKPANIGLSFQRGLVEWQIGRYGDAETAFAKVADAGQSYGWLWQQIAKLKQGGAAAAYRPPQFDVIGLHYKGQVQNGWPAQVIALYAGEHDEAYVLSALGQEDVSAGMTCEGNFYVAEWRLLHGDTAGGKPLMEKAASDCPAEYVELRMAKFELEKLP
jgi:lipoprotein NlpI